MEKNIKDMLKSGEKTPDELRELLEEEIAAAEKELGMKSLDVKRENLVESLVDYLVELKVINTDELDGEIIDMISKEIEKLEPELKRYGKILRVLLENEDEKETKPKIFKTSGLTKYMSKDIDIDKKMSDLVDKVMRGLI